VAARLDWQWWLDEPAVSLGIERADGLLSRSKESEAMMDLQAPIVHLNFPTMASSCHLHGLHPLEDL